MSSVRLCNYRVVHIAGSCILWGRKYLSEPCRISTSQFTPYNVGVARLIVFSHWGEVMYNDWIVERRELAWWCSHHQNIGNSLGAERRALPTISKQYTPYNFTNIALYFINRALFYSSLLKL